MRVMSGLTIGVVGAGYVGLASALSFAHVGHRVRVLERDAERVAMLRARRDPLGEPGFDELLAAANIEFTNDPAAAYAGVDAVLIAVGTPTGPSGNVDLSQLDSAAESIARSAPPSAVLIRSTVPVGTGDELERSTLRGFAVTSNPEFLREGRALADSLRPTRILAGGDPSCELLVRTLYAPIIEQRYDAVAGVTAGDPVSFLWTDRRTAELAKYAANAFLVTKLSFVNEIANLSAALGADVRRLLEVLGSDPRIGSSFLRPGLGWGGSCFPKDTRALLDFAVTSGYELSVVRAVVEQNAAQLLRFLHQITREVAPGSRIALLGLAFKAGTADDRESPAVALAELLLERGYELIAFDPAVRKTSARTSNVLLAPSAIEAAVNADAVVIATEWPEFAALDLTAVRERMRGDLLFDGRCILDPKRVKAAGLRYRGVCAPAQPPTSTRSMNSA